MGFQGNLKGGLNNRKAKPKHGSLLESSTDGGERFYRPAPIKDKFLTKQSESYISVIIV